MNWWRNAPEWESAASIAGDDQSGTIDSFDLYGIAFLRDLVIRPCRAPADAVDQNVAA